MAIFHPKYIPNSHYPSVSKEPTPTPFNPLYNGRAKFDDNDNEKIWRYVALVAFGLLLYNYYRVEKKRNAPLPPLTEEEKKGETVKRRNDIWISDTSRSHEVILPKDILMSPALAVANLQQNGVPKDYNIVYTPPPMPELPTLLEPKTYIVSKGITVKDSELKHSLSTPKLVFAGSFDTRQYAEEVLQKLKSIGYEKAEIIMKERLPHLIVVTGFDYQKHEAAAIVKALHKRGVEVYAAETDAQEIFRARK